LLTMAHTSLAEVSETGRLLVKITQQARIGDVSFDEVRAAIDRLVGLLGAPGVNLSPLRMDHLKDESYSWFSPTQLLDYICLWVNNVSGRTINRVLDTAFCCPGSRRDNLLRLIRLQGILALAVKAVTQATRARARARTQKLELVPLTATSQFLAWTSSLVSMLSYDIQTSDSKLEFRKLPQVRLQRAHGLIKQYVTVYGELRTLTQEQLPLDMRTLNTPDEPSAWEIGEQKKAPEEPEDSDSRSASLELAAAAAYNLTTRHHRHSLEQATGDGLFDAVEDLVWHVLRAQGGCTPLTFEAWTNGSPYVPLRLSSAVDAKSAPLTPITQRKGGEPSSTAARQSFISAKTTLPETWTLVCRKVDQHFRHLLALLYFQMGKHFEQVGWRSLDLAEVCYRRSLLLHVELYCHATRAGTGTGTGATKPLVTTFQLALYQQQMAAYFPALCIVQAEWKLACHLMRYPRRDMQQAAEHSNRLDRFTTFHVALVAVAQSYTKLAKALGQAPSAGARRKTLDSIIKSITKRTHT